MRKERWKHSVCSLKEECKEWVAEVEGNCRRERVR